VGVQGDGVEEERGEYTWVSQNHTVKAPNFDRVFMKNIFFLRIFVW
jgi:hypothetical protein